MTLCLSGLRYGDDIVCRPDKAISRHPATWLPLKRHGFRLRQMQRCLAEHRLGNDFPVANGITGGRLA